ncbi:MAG: hypothetical protein COA58_11815 [Bacteroidetes bacterium]|nr:MAG: hypothetical protein COA58_11815 [Bacteroidota bacterium]
MEIIKRVLVTGGGAPGAPGILNALKQSNSSTEIFSCDIQENTAGKILADSYFTVPSGDTEQYIPEILQKCIEHKISTILPITTKELLPLSKNKKLFIQNNINVLVSEFDELSVANDKGKLYAHLDKHHIATPSFCVVNNHLEYIEAAKPYINSDTTFIVKPCFANGSRGFRIVGSDINEGDLLFNHKPNSTHISSSKLNSILSSYRFPQLLVSEYLPGREYTVDCLIQNGDVKFIIPRLREKMNNGISVEGTIEKNDEVIDYCYKILQSLRLDGPIGIQVKYSIKDKPLIVEINPRIQGTTVALMGAGVNIPALCTDVQHLQNFTKPNEFPIKWGTKFIRHYNELYF